MILLLGSDGYIGKEFLAKYDALGVDSLYKRDLLDHLNIPSLYPVTLSDKDRLVDATEEYLSEMIGHYKPDTIIHLAEQPSAPYSMRDVVSGIETVMNNVLSTLNIIMAVKEHSPDTHIIKLGSMGTYGTPEVTIPEGWFDCTYKGRSARMLFPSTPHSLYHTSKVCDSQLLAFACRVWGLRVTDLHQGFVYGSNGLSRFCYDEMFGTVLNRFIVQAVAGIPLTVYGEGGQTRGMIHINDTVNCLQLAHEHPPEPGEYRVANQLTQWMSVNELAQIVREVTDCKIDHMKNPRKEKENHFYEVEFKVMEDYGLEPQLLCHGEIQKMVDLVTEHKKNINPSIIQPKTRW